MVDTDYETYAAYVECNGDFTRNFPVISSTTQELPEEKVPPAVNFSIVLHVHFSYEILVHKGLKAKTKLCNFWRQNFAREMRA